MDISDIFCRDPYDVPQKEKERLLFEYLCKLTDFHRKNCRLYNKFLENFPISFNYSSCEELPFLPVRLFKYYKLSSVNGNSQISILSSSGTTSTRKSQVLLDRETSINQGRVLRKILKNFLPLNKYPFLVIDAKNTVYSLSFSARKAGILGFSSLASDICYALTDDMKLDVEEVKNFLARHSQDQILVFGFTYIIWKYLLDFAKQSDVFLDLSNAILFHGGGWKKLSDLAVSNDCFKASLFEQFKIKKSNIHDYYGMAEQTGSISVECEYGNLHASTYSDIVIRDPNTMKIVPNGVSGLIETISIIPKSYPGHIILTEDIGIIEGIDNCKCGRKGKFFKILGRLPKAELRGCSDTYAENN